MNGRLVSGGIAGFILLVVNAGLIATERVAEPIPTSTQNIVNSDPLNAMQYNPSGRRQNLELMGFDSGQITTAIKMFEAMGLRYHAGKGDEDQIHKLIEATEERSGLVIALCGRGSELPPRYAAMAYLVQADGKLRVPIDLAAITDLDFQPWFDEFNPLQIYRAIEDRADRKDDATRMALAAILSGRETEAINRVRPWGDSPFTNPWSWPEVKAKTGVEEKLLTYVVNWHLVMEVARAPDKGICST